jgi:RNA polymerase sigma factor (sigma-70 family)
MADKRAREEAFVRIYESHYGLVSAYARRRVTAWQDADDIVAETFFVVWRRLEDVPGGDLTLPWLYGVARKVVSQGLRSSRRRNRLLARLGSVEGREEVVTPRTDAVDDQELVRAALARLRKQDQELLRLSEWEDLDARQLAQIFSCSVNAITIRLHRAHTRFAKALSTVAPVKSVSG